MYSQTAEYALRAMSCLAVDPAHLMPTGNLADLTKVPPNYLAKVLQQLAASGLITGRRGVGGGYKLARAAEAITLLDVINAVCPVERITACPLGINGHDGQLCALHRRADEAAAAMMHVFASSSLADLVNDSAPRGPLCSTVTAATLTVQGTVPLT